MPKNAFAAGAPPRTPLGELTGTHFKGERRAGEGGEKRERERVRVFFPHFEP